MSVEEQDYKLEVLEYAVNQCIDKLLPGNSEDALSIILYQSNEVVWGVTTEIYTKSGHQIDFVFIRDILNLRIEPLREKIAEEERIRKEKELKQAKIKTKQERIKKEQKAKLEAERLAKVAEQARMRREKKAEEAKFRKQKEEAKQKTLQKFCEIYPNIDIDIFLRIEKLIIKELEVEEEQITLDSIFSEDLGADDLDAVELIQAIEEEFDIEMPDEYELFGIGGYLSSSYSYKTLKPITVKDVLDLVSQKIQHE